MEYEVDKGEIRIDKVLNIIDKFTIRFISTLSKHTEYVIVSGYVSILLGRTRATEDVDLLIPKMNYPNFAMLFSELIKEGYECANTSSPEEAYDMLNEFAVRFFEEGHPTPNIEFKMIKTDLDNYSFENKIKVIMDEIIMYISPLELQIPYKLFLAADGTEEELSADKDIEDARFLYKHFKEKLNKGKYYSFIDKLKVYNKVKWLEWK